MRDVRDAIAPTPRQLQSSLPTLSVLLEQQKCIQELNPPAHWFERNLQRHECLVMLDGLDEVSNSHFETILRHFSDPQIRKEL